MSVSTDSREEGNNNSEPITVDATVFPAARCAAHDACTVFEIPRAWVLTKVLECAEDKQY